MVGTPGRSQACQQCRQRRVACGLQRPECSQCLRKNRNCSYERRHIFVNNDQGTYKTVYRKTDAIASELEIAHKQNSPARIKGTTDHHGLDFRLRRIQECSPNLAFSKGPTLGPSIQQALLASAVHDGRSSSAYSVANMLSRSLELDAPGFLYAAPLACYAVWRGRQDRNAALIDASHQLYLRALVETQKALNSIDTARQDSTLAACNALGLFEALECPEKTKAGYQWHRNACCRLIRIRGPAAHKDGFGHALFVSVRTFGVLAALETAESTFFTDYEWLTTPWLNIPKSPLDKLVDALSRGPAILRKAHTLEATAGNRTLEFMVAALIDIVQDLSAVLTELDSCYEELERNNARPLCWQNGTVDATYTTSSGLEFPPILQFNDPGVATELTLYWATLAMVWSALADISDECSQLGAGDAFLYAFQQSYGLCEDMSSDALHRRWLENVRNVCQSVAYCTTDTALRSGPPRVTTALSMITNIIKRRQDATMEYAWALNARRIIGERWVKLLQYHP